MFVETKILVLAGTGLFAAGVAVGMGVQKGWEKGKELAAKRKAAKIETPPKVVEVASA